MPADTLLILTPLFLVVGAFYACVGHAGASGYLAVMALLSVAPEMMRPTALAINVLVATIAFVQFARAGHFSWALAWPFLAASIPAAYLGGTIDLPDRPLRAAIGGVLLLTALRMGATALRPAAAPNASPATRPPALPAALATGGVVGLISGLTGTGGGIFLSPILLLARWADTKRTAATSACFILANSLAGLGGLAGGGWTPQPWLIVLAGAACVGGVMGAHFGSRRATPRALTALLAGVLLIAGAKLMMG
jgi:uncharacterized membrane protein YfcA